MSISLNHSDLHVNILNDQRIFYGLPDDWGLPSYSVLKGQGGDFASIAVCLRSAYNRKFCCVVSASRYNIRNNAVLYRQAIDISLTIRRGRHN